MNMAFEEEDSSNQSWLDCREGKLVRSPSNNPGIHQSNLEQH